MEGYILIIMGKFLFIYCPVCGANKPISSFEKPKKKLPFGRWIESLGRSSLRTVKTIFLPFEIDTTPVKKRLLNAVRNWYDLGLIENEDVDTFLCDMISEFNEWTSKSTYKEAVFRSYVKKSDTTYSNPENRNSDIKRTNTRRVTKSWM